MAAAVQAIFFKILTVCVCLLVHSNILENTGCLIRSVDTSAEMSLWPQCLHHRRWSMAVSKPLLSALKHWQWQNADGYCV